MMKVHELIKALQQMPDHSEVLLMVHDGEVDRENTPQGYWFTLPVENLTVGDYHQNFAVLVNGEN
jgi:hypothetical protein